MIELKKILKNGQTVVQKNTIPNHRLKLQGQKRIAMKNQGDLDPYKIRLEWLWWHLFEPTFVILSNTHHFEQKLMSPSLHPL
jgi:hypothetical protein